MSETDRHIEGQYNFDGEYRWVNDPWFWAFVYFVLLMVGALL